VERDGLKHRSGNKSSRRIPRIHNSIGKHYPHSNPVPTNNSQPQPESNIYFFHNQEDNNVAPERKLKHHHLCISFEILSGSAAIHLSYLQEIICCHESLASVSYFSVQSPAISVHFIFQRNEQTKKPSYAQPLASSRPIYADLI